MLKSMMSISFLHVLKPLGGLHIYWHSRSFCSHRFTNKPSQSHLYENVNEGHWDLAHVGAFNSSMRHITDDAKRLKWKRSDYFAVEVIIYKVHGNHHEHTCCKTKSALKSSDFSVVVFVVLLLNFDHFLLLSAFSRILSLAIEVFFFECFNARS